MKWNFAVMGVENNMIQPLLILFKTDTLDKWKESNHIPRPNEVICAMVTSKEAIYKLGDGIHKWNDLPERTFEDTLLNGTIYACGYKIKIGRSGMCIEHKQSRLFGECEYEKAYCD